MVADRHAGSADSPNDEPSLLTRARALRAELRDTFTRVLASQDLSTEDVVRLVRRLERDPATRRALDAARHDAGVPATRAAAPFASAPLPRDLRALRV